MIVDILEIESSDVGGARLKLKQNEDRSAWNTVGASVQAALNGGNGTPSEYTRISVEPSTGLATVLAELVALGNHGRVYMILATPTEVASMVSHGDIPNS
jgi:hypothetical protein